MNTKVAHCPFDRRTVFTVLFLSLAGCSCEDGGRTVSGVEITVAEGVAELGSISPACPGAGRLGALPSWRCVRLSLTDGAGRMVPLSASGVSGAAALVLPFGANDDFSFDIPETRGPFTLDLTVHDASGNPVAVGSSTFQDFDGRLQVPSHLLGEASCLALPEGDIPVARGFHRAVRLPNGDVLVFGGVRGIANPQMAGNPNVPSWSLQTPIESYRPNDGTWVRAQLPAGGEAAFSGVLFSASVDQTADAEGRFRVRTVGGINRPGGQALAVDPDQLLNSAGGPVVPLSAGVVPLPDFELIYDPADRSVQVNSLQASAAAGGTAVSGGSLQGTDFALVELSDPGIGTEVGNLPAQEYAAAAFQVPSGRSDRVAVAGGLLQTRFGATATRLVDNSGWLVFGGIRATAPEQLVPDAGETVQTDGSHTPTALSFVGSSSAVAPGSHIPGFHSMGRVGSTLVSAGGLQATCDCGTAADFPYSPTLLSAPSLFRVDVSGGIVTAEAVAGAPLAPSIFHGTTQLLTSDGSEDVNQWLISGGAGPALAPSDQVLLVADRSGTPTAEVPVGAANLIQGRFGHQVVALDEHRVLVHGGVVEESAACTGAPRCFRTIAGGEMLLLGYSTGQPASVDAVACDGMQPVGLDGGT